MKKNRLQDIWQQGSSNIERQTVEQLNAYLEGKVAKVMRKHFFVNYISITVGLLMIVLLIYAGVNKAYDIYYLINNIILCFIIIIFVVSTIRAYYKMNYNTIGLPFRDWLRYRINELSKFQKSYSIRYLCAVLIILPSYLSFFVYFVDRPFLKVLMSEQFYFSYFIVFIGGSFSAFLAIWNIRRYNKKILETLKDLYAQLSDCV